MSEPLTVAESLSPESDVSVEVSAGEEQPSADQPSATEPKVEASNPAETKPPEAAPKVEPPPASPASQPPQPQDQEINIDHVREQEGRILAEMAKLYQLRPEELALTKAEAEAFVSEPEKAIPAFIARILPSYIARCGLPLYYATHHAVNAALPGVVSELIRSTTAQDAAVNNFFAAFPSLDKNNPDHVNVIVSFAKLYREQHPNATSQEMQQFVGRSAMAYLGLSSPPAPAPQQKLPPYKPPIAAPAQPSAQKPSFVEEVFDLVS